MALSAPLCPPNMFPFQSGNGGAPMPSSWPHQPKPGQYPFGYGQHPSGYPPQMFHRDMYPHNPHNSYFPYEGGSSGFASVSNYLGPHHDTTTTTSSCHRSPPSRPDSLTEHAATIAPALSLNYDFKCDVAQTTDSTNTPIPVAINDLKSEVESRSNCGSNFGSSSQISPPQLYPRNFPQTKYAMPTMLMPSTGPRTEFAWMRQNVQPSGCGTNSEWVKDIRVRTKEKYRRVYSDCMRLELEKEFCTNKYITIQRKTELSKQLALTERQVKIWFQNRRAKERRSTGKTPLQQQADCGLYNMAAKLGFGGPPNMSACTMDQSSSSISLLNH